MDPVTCTLKFKKRLTEFGIIICVCLSLFYGCGKDSDAVVVDFSKTVTVEQPGKKSPENLSFRVAVAAMISPKETFVYYRQLLDYIGSRLDRDVQLIQRKTYEEINELLGKGQ
ncbi:MAG: hypothetical protein PVG00_16685, partial [Desulfobacterales bacterium]